MTCEIEVGWGLRTKERLVAPVWRLYRDLETELHPLRYLFWETTLRCNFSCRHCGSECTTDARVKEPAADQVLEVFRDVAAAYDAAAIMIVAAGGEPLVRMDVIDVLRQAHGLGFPWGMVTHGSLVTSDVSAKWVDCQGNALHGYDFQAGHPSRCHFRETRDLVNRSG